MDDKFVDVKKDINELKIGFNNLTNAVDAYAKKADTYFQEMVALKIYGNRKIIRERSLRFKSFIRKGQQGPKTNSDSSQNRFGAIR